MEDHAPFDRFNGPGEKVGGEGLEILRKGGGGAGQGGKRRSRDGKKCVEYEWEADGWLSSQLVTCKTHMPKVFPRIL